MFPGGDTTRFPRARARTCARGVLLLAVVTIVVPVLAGCGRDSDAGPQALSKREYIARMNEQNREAGDLFARLSTSMRSPRAAEGNLAEFDAFIAVLEQLVPPRDWADEHADMVTALREMRVAIGIISRASSRNAAAITTQVARFEAAEADYQAAVRRVNETR